MYRYKTFRPITRNNITSTIICNSRTAVTVYTLATGLGTYGPRAQNGTRHSLLSEFFYIYFALPASLYCKEYVYIALHISNCVQNVYDLPLLTNNTASEMFSHKSGAVRSVDWISIIGAPAWRRQGRIRDIGQSVLQSSFQTGSSSSPIIATVSFLSHSSRICFLDM